MSVADLLRKNESIHRFLSLAKEECIVAKSYVNLFKTAHGKAKGEKVSVVFLCQDATCWDKLAATYDRMRHDENFAPSILCVPTEATSPETCENDTYDAFLRMGYAEAINCCEKGEWLPLSALAPDFILYLMPYDNYLPAPYKSHNAAEHARLGLVPYGIGMTRTLIPDVLNRRFMADVSFFFADSAYAAAYNQGQNTLKHRLGWQNSLFVGLPSVERLYLEKGKDSASWDFSGGGYRVMWTPRWSTDTKAGGSNFMPYHENFLAFADAHETDVDLLLRPHPMMFGNFIRSGIMSEDQVASFKQACETRGNVSIDTQKTYFATFWHADLLVSDFSSIIPEFFVTGKPIIYCPSDQVNWDFIPEYEKMLSGCYIAHSFSQIAEWIEKLLHGEDELAARRQELIRELFPQDLSPSEIICSTLLEAAKGRSL